MSEPLTDGMKTTLGHVRLRVNRGPRFLGANGDAVSVCDIQLPGAVLGRGLEADIRILDGEDYISRRHFALEPSGLQWFARDLQSAHGTELQIEGTKLKLYPWIGMPVTNGDQLLLAGGSLVLTVEVVRAPQQGKPTRDPKPPSNAWRIEDRQIHELINALLEPRRHGRSSTHTPTVAQLADAFGISKRAVYKRLEKLRKIDAIARRLPAKPETFHYAEAILAAYPHLGWRRPEGQ
jgi:predicted component of type VI protein secretion system